MVAVPDVRQAAWWDCGRAAAFAVCDLYGVSRPTEWPGCPAGGTNPRAVELVFRAGGFWCQSGEMTVGDLRHHTEAEGRPVLVLVQFGGVGHYRVVRGARSRRVYFQCPMEGPGSEHETAFVARWAADGFVRYGLAVWRSAGSTGGRRCRPRTY